MVKGEIRVKDLPSNPGQAHLYCSTCNESWSASAGDYFMIPLETVMRCQTCGLSLKLTTTVTREEEVSW
jgi:hypothetical protein